MKKRHYIGILLIILDIVFLEEKLTTKLLVVQVHQLINQSCAPASWLQVGCTHPRGYTREAMNVCEEYIRTSNTYPKVSDEALLTFNI